MLAELENKGVSLDVVYELSRVLDLQKIAKDLSARTDPWSSIISTDQNGMNNGYNPRRLNAQKRLTIQVCA